jgi:hypothetical protein
MLNYLKKFALEILPSVAATVIGAYIVNHYISKPPADAPVAAVTAPAGATKGKPADGPDVANAPQPGVKAKGISERGMIEKAASEQPGEFKPAEAKAESKPVETKPAETASAPAEPRRHFWSAPKTAAKTTPAPAASPAAPAETAAATSAPADGRDANDLARAAIERLRGANGQPKSQDKTQEKTQEAVRMPDAPRVDAPRTVAPEPATASLKPLPPPITVAPPPVEQAAVQPPYTASVDPNRPVPPAEIPPPPPIDIRADASKLANRTTNMAQDMLRSAKSMFHAVIPGSGSDRQSSSSASQFTD